MHLRPLRFQYEEPLLVVVAVIPASLVLLVFGAWLHVGLGWNEFLVLLGTVLGVLALAFGAVQYCSVPVEVSVTREGLGLRPMRGRHCYRSLGGVIPFERIERIRLFQPPKGRPDELTLLLWSNGKEMALKGNGVDLAELTGYLQRGACREHLAAVLK